MAGPQQPENMPALFTWVARYRHLLVPISFLGLIIVLVVLIGGGIAVMGLVVGPPEARFETSDTSHDLPGGPVIGELRDSPGAQTDRLPSIDLGDAAPPPGRVYLDVGLADFRIETGEPGVIPLDTALAEFTVTTGADLVDLLAIGEVHCLPRVRFADRQGWE